MTLRIKKATDISKKYIETISNKETYDVTCFDVILSFKKFTQARTTIHNPRVCNMFKPDMGYNYMFIQK